MRLTAVCCTYKRPAELRNAIACFLWQTHEDKRMVVLDDAGTYLRYHGREIAPNVRVYSTPRRFLTLGEKRNACAALAPPGTDAYCVWDDDDVYLPDHMSFAAGTFDGEIEWVRPARVYVQLPDGPPRFTMRKTNGLFHGGWSYSRRAFAAVQGYPFMQSGQDQALGKLFDRHLPYSPAEPSGRPTYMYRYGVIPGGYNLSAMDKAQGYDRLRDYVPARYDADGLSLEESTLRRSHDWVRLREEALA